MYADCYTYSVDCVLIVLCMYCSMHYRLYYALYLYENDSSLTASDLNCAFQSGSGQQSIRKYGYPSYALCFLWMWNTVVVGVIYFLNFKRYFFVAIEVHYSVFFFNVPVVCAWLQIYSFRHIFIRSQILLNWDNVADRASSVKHRIMGFCGHFWLRNRRIEATHAVQKK